jgi:ABC-type transport system involved in multi-copper enzyme maturation permease subunit
MSRRLSWPRAVGGVFDLSVGQMLWSRRTIFMALITGVPLVMGAAVRLLESANLLGIEVDGVQMTGPVLFGLMIWVEYLRFIVPVLGVFYGTALIADEVDDKTITYLFTRPIARGAVLLGKYLAYLVCSALVVLPSVVLLYLLIVPIRGDLGGSFGPLLIDLGLLATGLAVYGALFALVGAALKRPLVIGLVFVIGWEPTVLVVPGYLRRFTVAHYVQGLVPHAMPQTGTLDFLQGLFRDVPSTGSSLLWLAAILAVSLWLAVWIVEHREYVVEQ